MKTHFLHHVYIMNVYILNSNRICYRLNPVNVRQRIVSKQECFDCDAL